MRRGSYRETMAEKVCEMVRISDLPEDEGIPVSDTWKSKVMHAALTFGDGVVLYFSDTWEDMPLTVGSNTTVHLSVDSEEDVRRIVAGLAQGGEVTMPVDKTFWGSVYGSLVDAYGIHWGVEYELPS